MDWDQTAPSPPSSLAGRLSRRKRSEEKHLELEEIVNVLKGYHEYEGGVNCSVCGKLYKSKVCLTKHLWEHSIYWDRFAGEKNHDRVLSIQAALIIYSGYHGNPDLLTSLLVTSPHQPGEKPTQPTSVTQDANICDETKNHEPAGCHEPGFTTPEKKYKRRALTKTPTKRRANNKTSRRSTTSNLPPPPTFSLLDTGISPTKSARQM